jgi:hypothetical protein
MATGQIGIIIMNMDIYQEYCWSSPEQEIHDLSGVRVLPGEVCSTDDRPA